MKKAITVEHVSVTIKSSFDRFTFRLEKALGILKPSALQALGAVPASMASYLNNTSDEKELVLFNIFSQADLSAKKNKRKIKQYQVGNPEIMYRMTARHKATGLYFPIQLVVYEKPDRKVVVEYDLPSSVFGRFNDAEIHSDALILENNITNLIREAEKENHIG